MIKIFRKEKDCNIMFSEKVMKMIREEIEIENKIKGKIYNLKKDRKDVERVLLVCHGFYSDRHSSATLKVAEQLEETGTPVICFDWPGHGDNREELSVKNCISTLQTMEKWLYREFPQAEIILYGSSFGGYMILLYVSEGMEVYPDRIGRYIFLKSPAIRMDEILKKHLLSDEMEYSMKIPPEFYDDLKKNRLSADKIRSVDKHILAFHGDVDQVAPFRDLTELNCHNIEIEELKGAPHSFRGKYIDIMGQKMREALLQTGR